MPLLIKYISFTC